jgi:nitroreductase
MQQFASAARSQARPPIALAGISTSSKSSSQYHGSQQDGLKGDLLMFAAPSASRLFLPAASEKSRKSCSSIQPSPPQAFSPDGNAFPTDENNDLSGPSSATAMQSLLLSRRTISDFVSEKRSLNPAIDRAIACAQNAPNHKRTEPFLFKKLLTQSVIDDLSDIVYHVTLRKRREKDPGGAPYFAEQKRARWNQIPVYVVALVENQSLQDASDGEWDPYSEFPFVPPETERQLEDVSNLFSLISIPSMKFRQLLFLTLYFSCLIQYAACCAAVQNILLSLHAERIGSKWATGPVTKTKAFRELIKAKPTDRVVGLIMLGYPAKTPHPPRRRRTLDDLVEDL